MWKVLKQNLFKSVAVITKCSKGLSQSWHLLQGVDKYYKVRHNTRFLKLVDERNTFLDGGEVESGFRILL